MLIRDFISSDKETFISFAGDFYSGGAVLHTVPQSNFEKTFNLCIEKSPLIRGVMLEVDGKPAGYGLLSFMYSNEAGGMTILLEELYILEEHRGNGLGNMFFDWVAKEYPNAARMRLEVNPENERAIKLYKKRGYEVLNYIQMIME